MQTGPTSHTCLPKIGIDLGSTTAKLALLDTRDRVVDTHYQRHNTAVLGTIRDMLADMRRGHPDMKVAVSVTGSAGMGLAEQFDLPFIQEVVAATEAMQRRYPHARTLVDIGGEDSKMIFVNDHGHPDMRMNGSCAGGTGAFIDQMAALMNISLTEMDRLALEHRQVYPMASRCGVFAKTDVQNLLNSHVALQDIAASVYHAVAMQVVTALSRGQDLIPKAIFCGGPLCFLRGLRQALIGVLDFTAHDIILPSQGELFPALGAAMNRNGAVLHLDQLIGRLTTGRRNHPRYVQPPLPPLFNDLEGIESWTRRQTRYALPTTDLRTTDNPTVFLGIDAGSTTTKIVVLDRNGCIAFHHYAANNGDPVASVRHGLQRFGQRLTSHDVRVTIGRCAVTGYGENLIKAAFGIDQGCVETLAHYRGARAFNAEVSFILDIGGQDMKAISVRGGLIQHIDINEACSSGCGSFIGTFASGLGLDLPDFARKALLAPRPYPLGSRCTVFMNSKVKQALREGASVENISAGLAYSVIQNCLHKVLKIHDPAVLGEHIVAQGGTFRNPAIRRALETLLGREIVCPDRCEVMGAYGAALYARDTWCEKPQVPSDFIGLDRLEASAEVSRRQIHCKGCTNGCQVSKLFFGGGQTYYTGNRCERIFANEGQRVREGANLWTYKSDLLFDRPLTPRQIPVATIGIPRGLNFYENFPFWCTLLVECGCKVVLSPPSSAALMQDGCHTVMSENICFPAKLMHGHVSALIRHGVTRIFYPLVIHESREFEDAANTFNCPVIQGYPDVIRRSVDPARYGVSLDTPVVVFNDPQLLAKACYRYLKSFNITRRRFDRAFNLALSAQKQFKALVRQRGREVVARARQRHRTCIVLAGRPYHLDPLINQKAPDILAQLGVDVLTEDAVPKAPEDNMRDVMVLSQWAYTNRLYHAARWVSTQGPAEFVQLNSFGCGPDALAVDEAKAILEATGKTHTLLRVDEITSTGSIRLRLRSLVESLRLKPKRPRQPPSRERISTRPFMPADRRKKIIAPVFSPLYSPLIEAGIANMGYRLETLPPADAGAVEEGLKYINNDMCYPAIICIGDIIRALKTGRYDLDNTAVALTETGGPCRASNYVALLKKAMVAAGFARVPVISVATEKNPLNYQPGFELNHLQLVLLSFSAILFTSQILKMYYATAAREKRPGTARCILEKYFTLARHHMGAYGVARTGRMLDRAVTEFNRVAVERRNPSKVGIVGEIYMKDNPFGNKGIANWLQERGIEVVVPSILSFFMERMIDVHTNHRLWVERRGAAERLGYRLFEKYADGAIRRANARLNAFRHPIIPLHTIRELAAKADRILHLVNQSGEGWILPAEVATLAEAGVHQVVCIQPFACIANHVVAKGMARRFQELYPGLNLLFLDMDASDSAVNIFNRMEFMIRNAKQTPPSTRRASRSPEYSGTEGR